MRVGVHVYLKALRLPFLAGSLVPVMIGAAVALHQREGSALLFMVMVVGISCLHLGANLINDYYDAQGSDPVNVRFTPFSGGSRAIQEMGSPPWLMMTMGLILFGVALGTGFWIAALGRPLVLLIGGLGLAAAWGYSAPPLKLMSRGWGEMVIFLAFGPLVTLGSFYVMTGDGSWAAFLMGIPQGLYITAVIWINQFPDFEADRKTGKRNLVVRLGLNRARYLYCGIMLMGFIATILLVGVLDLSLWVALSFGALPLAWKAMMILVRNFTDPEKLIPAQALTIQTMAVHGLLMSLGLMLGRLTGS